MASHATTRPVRVLVDQSRETGASRGAAGLVPPQRFEVAVSHERLKRTLLRRFDVLVLAGFGPGRHSKAELAAIEAFVREGGGLLLAGSAGAHEHYCERAAADLPLNRVAALFGARFLSPGDAQGATRLAHDLVRGFPPGSLRLAEHEAFAGVHPVQRPLRRSAPVELPPRAEPLASHGRTGEPVAAALRHGQGRVFVVNDVSIPLIGGELCGSVVAWLGAARKGGGRDVPVLIAPREQKRTEGELTVLYPPALEPQVGPWAERIQRAAGHISSVLGQRAKPLKALRLRAACGTAMRDWWHGLPVEVGALTSSAAALHEAFSRLWLRALGAAEDMPWHVPAGLGREAVGQFLALQTMEALDLHEPAARIRGLLYEAAQQRDPDEKHTDLIRRYEPHPAAVRLLHELHEAYGPDLLRRALQLVSGKEVEEQFARPYTRGGDAMVHYLSRAAGQDLSASFQERGTTVRALPGVEAKSEEFAPALDGVLSGTLRSPDAPASERLDALLATIARAARAKDRWSSAERLRTRDRYALLAVATELAPAGDTRAAPVLERLARQGRDAGLRALAALPLAQMQHPGAAALLRSVAAGQDVRFRLEASYVLSRAGESRALREPRTVRFVSDGGDEHDMLRVWPVVEGYRVANVSSGPMWLPFPHGNWASVWFVMWVHTAEAWRRRGLSREALARTLAHDLARSRSLAMLDTGTRNVAHTLYRDFGFVDVYVGRSGSRPLEGPDAVPPVPGIVIADYREEDAAALAELHSRCTAGALWARPARPLHPPADEVVRLAWLDGALVGAALAHWHGEEAHLNALRLDPDAKPPGGGDAAAFLGRVGRALLASVHTALAENAAKRIEYWESFDDPRIVEVLDAAGYRTPNGDWVILAALQNLPQLLAELRPLLEKRLADSRFRDWHGAVEFRSPSHAVRLAIEDAHVGIEQPGRGASALRLTCSDEALTRAVTGRETIFAAALQLDARIEPQLNDQVRDLLETLLPRMPMVLGDW